MNYCESVFQSRRWKTREITIGKVGVGGHNPVRIQSMTTSSTRDIEATIEQSMRLADAGCEIVRVTVQGMKEAEACEHIKNGLLQKGYDIPLVADIHFYPPAAMKVVEFVDKVRVNPGNFVDKRAIFKKREYDDASYSEEVLKIEEGFSPLVKRCKELNKALRIGTNHGSLSDRIMNRYGDTPFGMVESALEFARVCRQHDFHNFLFSMKASNPLVMIQAYRLLVAEMQKLGWDYPLHLGVTEAGEGEDGRVKSAVGIGALLLDGLGDTIRVSLTEDPWAEIDPCQKLVNYAKSYEGKGISPFIETHRDIKNISRRTVSLSSGSALHRDGSVILAVTQQRLLEEGIYEQLGCTVQLGRPIRGLQTPDVVFIEKKPESAKALEVLENLQKISVGILTRDPSISGSILLKTASELTNAPSDRPIAIEITSIEEKDWDGILSHKPEFILFSPQGSRLHAGRHFMEWMKKHQGEVPVILAFSYDASFDDVIIQASTECGALLADGLGEGVCLQTGSSMKEAVSLSFALLQAVRLRTVKTEFISCPGCGRTLFDLQNVSKRIRERTSHLPGVKIAIMGCIVNGPGEMADADFGYVGSRPGKIDLYIGKQCVEKNIDFADADERLVDLIKAHGRWIEPQVPEIVSVY